MSAESSGVRYMPHLDGLRAFAVGGVILEHWASGFPGVLRDVVQRLDLGGLGVECFFVLSGFLITLILLELKQEHAGFKSALGQFYIRRVLRIFPAYYAALLATVLIFSEMRPVAAWHALYLSNAYAAWHGGWPPSGAHFWSLAVEEQFYLFWPLVVLSFPLRIVAWIAITCFAVAPLTRFLTWHLAGGPHIAIWTLPTGAMDLLCFGALLACGKRSGVLQQAGTARRLALAGACALWLYVVLYVFFKGSVAFAVFGRTATAVLFGALVFSASARLRGPAGILLDNRLVIWLGTISYGLYIFHPFIPKSYLLLRESLGLHSIFFDSAYVRFPLLAAMLLAITSASYYFLERPVRSLRRRFSPARAPALQSALVN